MPGPSQRRGRAEAFQKSDFDAASAQVVEQTEDRLISKDANGLLRAQLSVAPVRAPSQNGWGALDLDLVDVGNGRSRPRLPAVALELGPAIQEAATITLGPGADIVVGVADINDNRAPQRSEDDYTFEAESGHVGFEVIPLPLGVETTYVLPTKAFADTSIREQVKLPLGWQARQGTVGIELVDAQGKVRALWNGGTALDASDDIDPSPVSVTLQSIEGRVATASVTVDSGWLHAAHREYPVRIDPSITRYSNDANAGDAWFRSGNPTQNAYSDPFLYAGWHNTTQDIHRSVITFIPQLPQNADVQAAYMRLWEADAPRTTTGVVLARRNASSWPNSVTWDTKPLTTDYGNQGVADLSTPGDQDVLFDLTEYVNQWNGSFWNLPGPNAQNFGVTLQAQQETASGSDRLHAFASGNTSNPSRVPTLEIFYREAPTIPEPTSPVDNAISLSAEPTLIGTGSTPAISGDHAVYQLQVATSPDGETGTVAVGGWYADPGPFNPPAGALSDGIYYWRIVAAEVTPQGEFTAYSRGKVRKLRINRRLGQGTPSPYDKFGPVSVNLATGNVGYSLPLVGAQTLGGPLGVTLDYNSQSVSDTGLVAKYFYDYDHNHDFNEPAGLTRIDPNINFDFGTGTPLSLPGISSDVPNDYWTAQWRGYFVPPSSASYEFGVIQDDGARVSVNGTQVLNRWDPQPATATPNWGPTTVNLTAGQAVPISVDFFEATGGAALRLYARRDHGATELVPTSWLRTDSPAVSRGWSASADLDGTLSYTSLKDNGGSVVLRSPDGATSTFTSGGTGAFTSQDGEDGLLSRNPDGTLTFIDTDGLTYQFRSDGVLSSATSASDDTKPAALSYSWSVATDEAPPRLTKLEDKVSGRALHLLYNSYDTGSCATLSPPSGVSGAQQGPKGSLCGILLNGMWPVVQMFYSSTGSLRSVSEYDTFDANNPMVTEFGYDSSGRLTSIREPRVRDAIIAQKANNSTNSDVAISYDTSPMSVTLGEPTPGAFRPKRLYTIGSTATVSDARNGLSPVLIRTAVSDSAGRQIQSTDEAGVTTTSAWNLDDNMTWSVDGAGLKSTTIYDYAKRPVTQYGPAPTACFTGDVPNGSCFAGVPSTTTAYDEGIKGLAATYWDNKTFDGPPKLHATGVVADGRLVKYWAGTGPTATSGLALNATNNDNWSARFTGDIRLPSAGTYVIGAYSDDGVRIFVDDILVSERWDDHANTRSLDTASVVNTGDSWHRIRVDYYENIGDANLDLQWSGPGVTAGSVPGDYLRPRHSLTTTSTTQTRTDGNQARVATTSFGVDPELGQPDTVTVDPGGSGHLNLQTATKYETRSSGSLMRRDTRTLPAGVITTGNANDHLTKYEYYANGDSVPSGACADASQIGQRGLLAKSKSLAPTNAVSNRFVYDVKGRVTGTSVSDGPWSCIHRDSRGRISTETASDGKTTTYTYYDSTDPLLTKMSYTDSSGASNRFTLTRVDLTGKPVFYQDENGTATRKTYDDRQRLIDTTRQFDQKPELPVTHQTYNIKGQLETVTDYLGATPRSTSYAYDTAGRLSTTTIPSGIVTTQSYDSNRGTPIGIKHQGSGRFSNWAYSRLLNGDIASESEPVTGRSRTFTYDLAGRLTRTVAEGGVTRNYAYDEDGNRCGNGTTCDTNWAYDQYDDRITKSPYATSYGYDSHGNNTSAVVSTPAGTNYITQGRAYDLTKSSASWPIPLITPQVGPLSATVKYTNDKAPTETKHVTGTVPIGNSVDNSTTVEGPSTLSNSVTWAPQFRTISYGPAPLAVAVGSPTNFTIAPNTSGTVTGNITWPDAVKNFTFPGSTGTVTSAPGGTWTSAAFNVTSNGQVCAQAQWGSVLTDFNVWIVRNGVDVASSTQVGGTAEPATGAVCYNETGVTHPTSIPYKIRVKAAAVNGSFTVYGAYRVTPNVDMVLKNAGGTTVATSSIIGGSRQRSLSYNAGPGNYTFAISSADEPVTASFSETHPRQDYAYMSLQLLNPQGSVVQSTPSAATGSASLKYTSGSAGTWRWRLVNSTGPDGDFVGPYTMDWVSTHTATDTTPYSNLAVGASQTRIVQVDGTGPVTAAANYSQGPTQYTGSPTPVAVAGGGSSSLTINPTSAGLITGTVSWPSITKTYTGGGGNAGALATWTSPDINVAGDGSAQICMRSTWSGFGQDMSMKIFRGATEVASSANVGGSAEPTSGSLCYVVPATPYGTTVPYNVKVTGGVVGGSFNLTGTYPVSPTVDMVLKNSGGTTVATSTLVGTNQQRTVSFNAPAAGTYSFVVSSSEAVTTQVAESHFNGAYGTVKLELLTMANNVIASNQSTSGSVSIETSAVVAGTYQLRVTNVAGSVASVPTLTQTAVLPRSGAFRLEVRDSVNSILTSKQTDGTPGNSVTVNWTVVAGGGYELKVVPISGHGLATVTEGTPGGTPARTITYDANDHATSINDGQQLTTEVLSPSGRVLERIVTSNWNSQIVEDTVYGYASDSDSPAYSFANGALDTGVTTYLGGLVDTAGVGQWRHANLHGDVSGTSDIAGNYAAMPIADEYGLAPAGSSGWDGMSGWLGSQQRRTVNANTGIVRMGVRLYDPAIGRFTGVDPVEGGSLNAYDYAGADPLNYFDLMGQKSCGRYDYVCQASTAIYNGAKSGVKAGMKKLFPPAPKKQPGKIYIQCPVWERFIWSMYGQLVGPSMYSVPKAKILPMDGVPQGPSKFVVTMCAINHPPKGQIVLDPYFT